MSNTKKAKKGVAVFALIILILTLLFTAFGTAIFIYARKNIDFRADEAMFETASGEPIRLYAKSGFLDNVREVEIRTLSYNEQRRLTYSLSEISPYLIDGFIAVEDRDFYKHSGVNLKRTLKATLNYIFAKDKRFGASTITQQVVKNISGDSEPTLKRKLSEIIRAMHMERGHSKEEILETYLNIVPMTDNMSGVGIAAGAYFGKAPSELTPAESATIIGITNAPARYNPYKNYDACIKKRNTVLYAMRECGVIDAEEYQEAISEPILLLPKIDASEYTDSWFVETVIEDVREDLMRELKISREAAGILIASGGLRVHTTMNVDIQNALEGYFENDDNFSDKIKEGLNYSMVISDSGNGDLLAVVGSVGKKRANRTYNFATKPVTPASTLKPLALYAPLIDSGRINWASVFDDVPVSFTEKGGEWHEYPHNSPNVYDGLVNTAYALEKSKNTVAIRLYNLLGAERIYALLRENYDFDTLVHSGYNSAGEKITDVAVSPLALGQLCYGVPLRKLTEAYTVFSSGGMKPLGRSYTAVYTEGGELLLQRGADAERVYSRESAAIMNKMLERVVDNGTAKGITLKETVDTAGKTGTSGNNKDKLFIGYTPYVTAGIWCGMRDGSSLSGITTGHLKIWDGAMKEIHELILKKEEAPKTFTTDGLLYLPYCKDSGMPVGDNCALDPRGEREEYGYFARNNTPSGTCDRHVKVLYDMLTEGVATDSCDGENLTYVSLLDISDRKFPKEITVTDAEYVYRDVGNAKFGDSYDIPFFYYALPEGEYVGRGKNKKQFNSGCYICRD